MRRGRIFIYLALILIIGLVAVGVVYYRVLLPAQQAQQQQSAQATPVVDVVNVIVVAQPIRRGTVLRGDMLSLVPIQRNLFIQGMFTNISEVEGRMAKFDLEQGVPITSGMLAETAEELSGAGSVAALSIPRGMVAVSIPISRLSSVAYAPQPGDHVNVMVTLLLADLDTDFQSLQPNQAGTIIAPGVSGETGPNYLTAQVTGGEGGAQIGKAEVVPGLGQTVYALPSERQRPRMVTQNLLQDVMVLQVGNFSTEQELALQAQQQEQQAANPDQEQAATLPPPPDVITLVVSPQDAIALQYLLMLVPERSAYISLALRAAEDDTRVQTQAMTLQFLMETYSFPLPAELPYGTDPRVDAVSPPTLQNDVQPSPQQ
jgi:Flp pilus assembly protein CpaB